MTLPQSQPTSHERWTRWCFDTCMLHGVTADEAAAITALFSRAIQGATSC